MTAVQFFAVAVLVLASGSRATQANATAAQSAVPQSSTVSLGNLRSELPLNGEMTGELDSKTAKIGDPVVVRTRSSMRMSNGIEVAKGSKLIGRVTGVKQAGTGDPYAQIALAFDRVELKNGESLSIQGEIQSVSMADNEGATDTMSALLSSMPAGHAPGDMYGSTPSIAPPAQVLNQAQAGSSRPSVAGTATTPGAVVARSGDLVIRTTAIPDLLLANHEQSSGAPQPSSILLGAKHDIHLERGTRMVIAIAPADTAKVTGAN